jgi:arsenate reductase (thioredoxin)
MDREPILFIATGDAAWAQLAAGLLRHLGGGRFLPLAATVGAVRTDPLATRALRELGIDPPEPGVAPLARYRGQPFGRVIALCDGMTET